MRTESASFIGQRFGSKVILEAKVGKRYYHYFVCKCDCGAIVNLGKYQISNNVNYKSCRYCSSKNLITHGLVNTPEYTSWSKMKSRCLNPKDDSYKDYGARGILVCQDWIDSFEVFYSDMGKRPTIKHTLDRFPNVNGNYEPSNCRWATRKEQQRNRRNSFKATINGIEKTVMEWSEIYGVKYDTLEGRIRGGMTALEAVTKPVRTNDHPRGTPVVINGETKLLVEWCKQYGIKKSIVWGRVNRLGWGMLEAIVTPQIRNGYSRNTMTV